MNRSVAPFAACPLRFPTKLWRARMDYVTDGDTCILYVDRGGEHFTAEDWEIRLASIDVWEARGDYPPEHLALGRQARELIVRLTFGRWCYLLTKMDPEMYGRILGDPFAMQDDGTLTDIVWELYKGGFQKIPSKYPYRGPTDGPRDILTYMVPA